jgi:rubrerythrin
MMKKFLVRIILEEAIAFEEKAYRFYQNALSRTVMGESAQMLRKLLVSELKHRMKLDNLQRGGDLAEHPENEMMEQEDFKVIAGPWPKLNPWSTREEVLEAALRKETESYEFYTRVAARAPLKTVRDTFHLLAQEEIQHMKWIRKEMGEAQE